MSQRSARIQGEESPDEVRSPFQRDRDRILYSEYFSRLAGVTQVASATDGGLFHNRLIHSIKVAQVGRRLAERLLVQHPDLEAELNADVVEAASLAHDLGHPPFGHAGERKLDEMAKSLGMEDGFEGNAQTFRIVTRLSIHSGGTSGLDLTRASLNATLKYPWERDTSIPERKHKFSVYGCDRDAFDFARQGSTPGKKCLEAHVMDLADSITYSVHDLEDFRRAGLVPLEKLAGSRAYRRTFFARWKKATNPESKHHKAIDYFQQDGVLDPIFEACMLETADTGSREDLEVLEKFRSMFITRLLSAITLERKDGLGLKMTEWAQHECSFFHQLVRAYVIDSPRLATQQYGQARIIEKLVNFFSKAFDEKCYERFPVRFRRQAEDVGCTKRIAIDVVASLSEPEAIHICKRIMGQSSGSILDPMN